MINIKDLQIGDWVMFPHGIDKIVDLSYIEGKGLCASFAASATLFPVPIEQIKPILLTPEILEKNGFEHEENAGYVWDNYSGIIVAYCTFTKRLRIIKDLNILFDTQDYADVYVHTLQHALRLCGIDKTIEL